MTLWLRIPACTCQPPGCGLIFLSAKNLNKNSILQLVIVNNNMFFFTCFQTPHYISTQYHISLYYTFSHAVSLAFFCLFALHTCSYNMAKTTEHDNWHYTSTSFIWFFHPDLRNQPCSPRSLRRYTSFIWLPQDWRARSSRAWSRSVIVADSLFRVHLAVAHSEVREWWWTIAEHQWRCDCRTWSDRWDLYIGDTCKWWERHVDREVGVGVISGFEDVWAAVVSCQWHDVYPASSHPDPGCAGLCGWALVSTMICTEYCCFSHTVVWCLILHAISE